MVGVARLDIKMALVERLILRLEILLRGKEKR